MNEDVNKVLQNNIKALSGMEKMSHRIIESKLHTVSTSTLTFGIKCTEVCIETEHSLWWITQKTEQAR